MFQKIDNYINSKEFQLNLYKNKINIINYKRLLSIEENYISVLTNNEKIIIKGTQLLLLKILDNELLIKGNIKSIEVINE